MFQYHFCPLSGVVHDHYNVSLSWWRAYDVIESSYWTNLEVILFCHVQKSTSTKKIIEIYWQSLICWWRSCSMIKSSRTGGPDSLIVRALNSLSSPWCDSWPARLPNKGKCQRKTKPPEQLLIRPRGEIVLSRFCFLYPCSGCTVLFKSKLCSKKKINHLTE